LNSPKVATIDKIQISKKQSKKEPSTNNKTSGKRKSYGFGWFDSVINFMTKVGLYFATIMLGLAIIFGFCTGNLIIGYGDYDEIKESIEGISLEVDELKEDINAKSYNVEKEMIKELKEINKILTDIKVTQKETQVKQDAINTRVGNLEDKFDEYVNRK